MSAPTLPSLLPCPFCGSDPQEVIVPLDKRHGDWEVICNGNWCDARVTGNSEADAIKCWNKRSDAALQRERDDAKETADYADKLLDVQLQNREQLDAEITSLTAKLAASERTCAELQSAGETLMKYCITLKDRAKAVERTI